MAYFAELDANNMVVQVLSIPDEEEHRGHAYLSEDLKLGGRWERTSYNTRGGVYYDPVTKLPGAKPAFRKNYAGIGYRYDAGRDAFIPPQPYPSWVLNDTSCLWEAPVPYPQDTKDYVWDESRQAWILLETANRM